jgi:hypothetical protein
MGVQERKLHALRRCNDLSVMPTLVGPLRTARRYRNERASEEDLKIYFITMGYENVSGIDSADGQIAP